MPSVSERTEQNTDEATNDGKILLNCKETSYMTDCNNIHALFHGLFHRKFFLFLEQILVNFSAWSYDNLLCSVVLRIQCSNISSASPRNSKRIMSNL
jgi:hypothetical protein